MAKKKTKKNSKQTQKHIYLKPEQTREISGIALAAMALFGLVSLFGYGGAAGRLLNDGAKGAIGVGWYVVPVLLLAWAAVFFVDRWRYFLKTTGLGLAVIFISFIGLIAIGNPKPFDAIKTKAYGGFLGDITSYVFVKPFGRSGAYIFLTAALLVGIIMASRISIAELLEDAASLRKKKAAKPKAEPVEMPAKQVETPQSAQVTQQIGQTVRLTPVEAAETPAVTVKQIKDRTYVFPPLDMLTLTDSVPDKVWKKNLNDRISIINTTLANFGVEASVDRVVRGPTITRFELSMGSGVKVNRIVSLVDDLSVALATTDVRILTPVPGKAAVGLEIPNDSKEFVTLGDVFAASDKKALGPLMVGLGKDISGSAVIADITKMPHLLIAGATGSGKTTCVNSIITSLLFFSHPDQVKAILVDPKMVELSHYKDIPHLIAPVITEAKKAAVALKWAVREMEDRFKIMAEAGARNIEAFNTGKADPEERLPYLIIVIDELADLMMVAPADVEEAICRLAQMGRAVGINMVVATQRPSVDVITGLIKANIPSRISFEVASQTDSRVILDMAGAEKLIGRGDMLYLPAGSVKPKRVQGAMLTEREIAEVGAFVRAQREPVYDESIIKEEETPWTTSDYVDPLLEQAIEIVVRTGQASVSMLQRRLRVGYSRAARLVDTMEERGIVGGADGSKPRAVLLSEEEYDRLKESGS